MRPKVSIVMPVFNNEKYLRETLDSIVSQTYHFFEVICVDDGSTDCSLNILEEYSNKDSRISIIKQNNQYAGIARNNGLGHATGKYIMFLDADDVFEKNMLSVLVRTAERKKTDIIFFGFYKFNNTIKKRNTVNVPFHSRTVCSPSDHKEDIFQIVLPQPWNKFYNREFVLGTGIQFQGIKSDNDQLFTKTIVLEAQKLLFINKKLVNYRVNNKDSIQGNYNVNSGNLILSTIAIYDALQSHQNYTFYQNSFENYVLSRYLYTFNKCKNYDSFKELCASIRESFKKMKITDESKAVLTHPAFEIWKMIISGSPEDSLFSLYNYLCTKYVPTSSIEYRIGKKILKFFKLKNYD